MSSTQHFYAPAVSNRPWNRLSTCVDILTYSLLKALTVNWAGHPADMWSYASLIRCNPRRFKAPLKGMSSHATDLNLLLFLLLSSDKVKVAYRLRSLHDAGDDEVCWMENVANTVFAKWNESVQQNNCRVSCKHINITDLFWFKKLNFMMNCACVPAIGQKAHR